jgi:hypothetical protein
LYAKSDLALLAYIYIYIHIFQNIIFRCFAFCLVIKNSVNTQETNLVELKRNIDEFKFEIDRVCGIKFRENSSVTEERFGVLVL